MGRSIFTEELGTELCRRMAEGRSLKNVCSDADMPDLSTVMKWLGREDRAAFAQQYTHAREACIQHMADDILVIADEEATDIVEVQKQKLKIDTRKWLLSKLAPKKYGDNATLKIGNEDGEPFKVDTGQTQAIAQVAIMLRAQGRQSDEERKAIIDQRDPEDYV